MAEPEEEGRPSFWMRVKESVFGATGDDDEETPLVESRRRGTIRLDNAGRQSVAVRLNAAVFNDARIAADGLKAGQQQIVNLERAAPDMAERIIDFLSGVTYALDGSVDRVGEKVYLFVPSNVQVELDGGSEPPAKI